MLQQQNKVLAHLLEQLPLDTREIVILYYREEQNSRAVAQLLDINVATVRKRLQRVRAQLKQDLLKQYGKILLATAPVGLSSSLAISALSATQATAATLAYQQVVQKSVCSVSSSSLLETLRLGE